MLILLSTLRPAENGGYLAEEIFKYISEEKELSFASNLGDGFATNSLNY